jgi:ubiquitin C-terminal hydrolase
MERGDVSGFSKTGAGWEGRRASLNGSGSAHKTRFVARHFHFDTFNTPSGVPMPAITAWYVTYGSALAPSGYHRVTRPGGGGAELRPLEHDGRACSSLWYRDSPGGSSEEQGPIVDICILYGEEETPVGWEKVDRDISKGGEQSSFLCFRRASDDVLSQQQQQQQQQQQHLLPIGDAVITFDDDADGEEQVAGEDWEPVKRSLVYGRNAFLWYKRVRPGEGSGWSGQSIREGDWLDVKDSTDRWVPAKAVSVEGEKIGLRYKDLGPQWDMYYYATSTRLAELGCKTGLKLDQVLESEVVVPHKVGSLWAVTREELQAMADRVRGCCSPSFTLMLPARLHVFIMMCMTSNFEESSEVLCEVQVLLQACIDFVVASIRYPEHMSPHTLQLLLRIANADSACTWYYSRYGVAAAAGSDWLTGCAAEDSSASSPPAPPSCSSDAKGALPQMRQYVSVEPTSRCSQPPPSQLYLDNINHFGRNGGFDAILLRIDDPTNKCSLQELSAFMEALKPAVPHLDAVFSREYFKAFQRACSGRLGRLSADELRDAADGNDAHLDHVMKQLERLLLQVVPGYQIAEESERFKLSLVKQLLCCPFLKPRIKGILLLNEVMDGLRPSTGAYSARRDAMHTMWITPDWLAQWMASEGIVETILGGEGNEHEHGGAQHVEVLRRAQTCLCFMAHARRLTLAHLDLLWEVGEARDSRRRIAYSLVITLASLLSEEGLHHLHGRFASLPAELEELQVEFVQKFAGAAITRAQELAAHAHTNRNSLKPDTSLPKQTFSVFGFGLEILWNATQEHAPVSPSVADRASEALAELLSHNSRSASVPVLDPRLLAEKDQTDAEQLTFLLDCCIDNVRKSSSVVSSLRLMQRLIFVQQEAQRGISSQAPMARRSSTLSRDHILMSLEREAHIIDLVLSDLLTYRQRAKMELLGRGEELQMDSVLTGGGGRANHEDALQMRLDFISFVADNCPAQIDFEVIQKLWAVFVEDPLSFEEGELFFRWLRTTAPADSANRKRATGGGLEGGIRWKTFNENTMLRIFEELLCERCNSSTLGQEGYACLEHFFLFCNAHSGCISGVSQRGTLMVLNFFAVRGVEELWRAFLLTPLDAVAVAAGEFVSIVHLRLDPVMPSQMKRRIWEQFLSLCMKTLERYTDVETADTPPRRVVGLLQRFFRDFAGTGTALQNVSEEEAEDEESSIKVVVKDVATRKVLRTLSLGCIPNEATALQLRARVAAEMRHKPDCVRLMNKTQTFITTPAMDSYTLAQCNLSYWCEAQLLEEPQEDTQGWSPPMHARSGTWTAGGGTRRRAPQEWLSNNESFLKVLFSLMRRGGELADETWGLLQSLPSNADLEASLLPPPSRALLSVLDPADPLQQLYCLKIVHRIVAPAVDPFALPGDRHDAELWGRAFLASRGMEHLLLLYMDEYALLNVDARLHRACLAVQLRLLAHFTLSELPPASNNFLAQNREDDEARAASDTMKMQAIMASLYNGTDLSKLTRRLLEVMTRVSSAAAQADGAVLTMRGRRHSSLGSAMDFGAPAHHARPPPTAPQAASGEFYSLPPEAEVVQHTMSLLVALTVFQPSLVDTFLQFPDLSQALLFGLVHTPESLVRKEVSSGVYRMAERLRGPSVSATDPAPFFIQALTPALSLLDNYADRCSQYFKLLSHLVLLPGAQSCDEKIETCRELTQLIIYRPVVELSREDVDLPLRGYIMLLRNELLSISSENPQEEARIKTELGVELGLVKELFESCLFSPPMSSGTENPNSESFQGKSLLPKCKSHDSRQQALHLLVMLAQVGPRPPSRNTELLAQLLQPHHHFGLREEDRKRRMQKEARKRYSLRPATNVPLARTGSFSSTLHAPRRHPGGYVGLKNLGCICYMNATLQQLFMVPEFRAGVLSFDAGETAEDAREESLVWQLQSLFAHLQEAEKSYYNPRGLCHSLRDWEGQPTDVLVQQDASEFITNFFQQVEMKIMGTPGEHVIKDTFGGVFSNELLAEGGRYSERPEPFFFITVDVKNHRSLHEGLDSFIAGGSVEYTWEDKSETGEVVKASLPTIKRIGIKSLPRHLIIHLKRFEFDFETMQQIKLNDRYEFPEVLDMRPYTKEGRAAREDESSGEGFEAAEEAAAAAAEEEARAANHPAGYYRYELSGVVVHMGTANSGHYYSYIKERGSDRKWFEFNDTIVTEFNPADIEVECFGGEEVDQYRSQTNMGQGWPRERIRNAFMVVYDQVLVRDGSGDLGAQVAPIAHAPVPHDIMTEILRENLDFWRKQNILDDLYYNFMEMIAGLTDWSGTVVYWCPELLQVMLTFVLGTLAHAAEADRIVRWVDPLKRQLLASPAACNWLLWGFSEDGASLYELCVSAQPETLRSAVVSLISVAVNVCACAEVSPAEVGSAEVSDPGLVRGVVETVLRALPSAGSEGDGAAEFLYIVNAYATSSPTHAHELVLNHGVLHSLLALLAGELETLATEDGIHGSRVARLDPPSNLGSLMKLLTSLVVTFPAPGAPPSGIRPLPKREGKLLHNSSVLQSMLLDNRAPAPLSPLRPLLSHLATNSRVGTKNLLDTALTGALQALDAVAVKTFLRAFLIVTAYVHDELEEWRVQVAVEGLLGLLNRFRDKPRNLEAAVEMMARLAQASPLARAELHATAKDWAWVASWVCSRMGDEHGEQRAISFITNSVLRLATPANLQAISQGVLEDHLGGQALPECCYHSDDDQASYVGRRISIRWTNQFYNGERAINQARC